MISRIVVSLALALALYLSAHDVGQRVSRNFEQVANALTMELHR